MSYQDHYPPPPPHHSSDPRFLHPQSSQASNMPELEQIRSRESVAQDGYTSDSSRYSRARQPINEAISSAFTDSSATTNAIPPDLLAQLTSQITANVIQQLKVSNLTTASVSPSIPAETKSSTQGSPPVDRATVYTPPSPFHSSELQRSPGKPAGLGVDMINGLSSPSSDNRAGSPLDRNTTNEDDRATRPKGPQRISTSGDMTVVEKIWGTLFSEQGEATLRLGQFLRGIAMHLIKNYEPKDSLVVTPAKMQRYYKETRIDSEHYPWKDIFDDRTSSISRMLRELEVQHHLVQEKPSERPDIPGMTPEGFQRWFTLNILANPDQEFERLAKTALDMPISNPDDKKERFPKELSRRLFPKNSDAEVESKLCKTMSVHCNLNLTTRHNSTAQERPAAEPRASDAGLSASATASDLPLPRPHSYSTSSSTGAAVVSDTEDMTTPQPIERERKPYVAQPGGGKSFETTQPIINPPASAAELQSPAPEFSKLRRASSHRESKASRDENGRPRITPISIHQSSGSAAINSAPIDIPETQRRHRNSTYYRDTAPSTAAPRRTRSPSASKGSRYADASDSKRETFHRYGDAADMKDSKPPSSRYSDLADGYHTSSVSNDQDKRYRDYEEKRERLAGDRYDSARMAAYDPRERERERGDMRPRGQSVASYGHSDDEYYRSGGSYPPPERGRENGSVGSAYSAGAGLYPPPNGPHYPPTSYREVR